MERNAFLAYLPSYTNQTPSIHPVAIHQTTPIKTLNMPDKLEIKEANIFPVLQERRSPDS